MDGILLLGYGGPSSLDDVDRFMESLMGFVPNESVLSKVKEHYRAIGGRSPLVDIAQTIAQDLRVRLGADMPVEVGMLHSAPAVSEAVGRLAKQGITRIIGVSLSPFYSTASNGKSFDALRRVLDAYGDIDLIEAPVFGTSIGYIVAQASALSQAMLGVEEYTPVFFTAHSLPLVDVEAGDEVYVDGLKLAASAIAETLGFSPADEDGFVIGDERAFGTIEGSHPWALVYQSQGMRGGAWLGPSLTDVITEVSAADLDNFVVCPVGFATEHMETLYDLDIKTKNMADEAGISLVRSSAPNNAPSLIDAIEDTIAAARASAQ